MSKYRYNSCPKIFILYCASLFSSKYTCVSVCVCIILLFLVNLSYTKYSHIYIYIYIITKYMSVLLCCESQGPYTPDSGV